MKIKYMKFKHVFPSGISTIASHNRAGINKTKFVYMTAR